MEMYRLIIYLLMYSGNTYGQYYFYNDRYYDVPCVWEIGISIGMMNCFTDIGGNTGKGKSFVKDINPQNSRACTGLYLHGLYNYKLGWRLELTAGSVSAFDSVLKNDQSMARYRYKRNLHFRSGIREIAAIGEWYLFSLAGSSSMSNSYMANIRYSSFYVLGGIGWYWFEPKAQIGWRNNAGIGSISPFAWISLQPLRTEGQGSIQFPQRRVYPLHQLNIPIGIGWRWELSALINLHVEIVHRILFTDYLDDVSTDYVDQKIFDIYLDPYQATLAKILSDRRRELDPNAQAVANQLRGDPTDKDAYFSFGLKLGLVLNRPRR